MVIGRELQQYGKQYYFGEQYSKALEALQKAYEYAHNIGAKELIVIIMNIRPGYMPP